MAADEEELQRIYQWIDEIPLSRPKRNISRDFADGVLVAEVVAHYYPRMVELHNYPSANSFAQKLYNWQTLSKKVFKKIGLAMSKAEMEALSNAEPGAVEQLLKKLQVHLAKYNLRKKQQAGGGADDSPGAGDYADEPSSPADVRAAELPQQQAAQEQMAPQQGRQPYAAHDSAAAAAPPPGQPMPSQHATASALAAGSDPLLLLQERDQTVDELSETVEILEIKVTKLEQLVRLKDSKIQTLGLRLQQYEANAAAAQADAQGQQAANAYLPQQRHVY